MLDISDSSPPPLFLALPLYTEGLAHQRSLLFLQCKHAFFHGIHHNVLKDKLTVNDTAQATPLG